MRAVQWEGESPVTCEQREKGPIGGAGGLRDLLSNRSSQIFPVQASVPHRSLCPSSLPPLQSKMRAYGCLMLPLGADPPLHPSAQEEGRKDVSECVPGGQQ